MSGTAKTLKLFLSVSDRLLFDRTADTSDVQVYMAKYVENCLDVLPRQHPTPFIAETREMLQRLIYRSSNDREKNTRVLIDGRKHYMWLGRGALVFGNDSSNIDGDNRTWSKTDISLLKYQCEFTLQGSNLLTV